MFKPATRKKVKLKLALTGPSGSGKTYGSLLIASGMGGKIAVIDTERGSASLYSDLVKFDVLELTPPFSPAKYIEAILAAEKAGYDVLVIDSLSHAWVGEGGIIERVENSAAASKTGNSFQAWGKVGTPEYNKLINAVVGANMHVIATMRSKTAYEVVENEKGKKCPKKIGLAPVQRDGTEFEFTIVFDLSVDGHYSSCSKNRTSLFGDDMSFVITEKTGRDILQWTQQGEEIYEPSYEQKIKEHLLKEIPEADSTEKLNLIYHRAKAEIKSHDYLKEIVAACAKRKEEVNSICFRFGELGKISDSEINDCEDDK